MKNSPSTFTEAALLVLFLIGIQYSDFGKPQVNVTEANLTEQTNNLNSAFFLNK